MKTVQNIQKVGKHAKYAKYTKQDKVNNANSAISFFVAFPYRKSYILDNKLEFSGIKLAEF